MKRGRYNLDDLEAHAAALETVRRRTKIGDAASAIAVELRCTTRTVVRYRAELRAAGVDVTPPAATIVHGHPSTYRYRGCRCRPCTTAYSAHMLRARREGPVRSHGAGGYQRGCRCDTCRAWQSERNRLRPRPRRRPKVAA